VTIACGDLLPNDINIIIHLRTSTLPLPHTSRKALHVQSRSYWAPANIGPYSQATSMPISSHADIDSTMSAVSIAGQIPLIPSTMTLPSPTASGSDLKNFKFQTVLSLQHLFRIGIAMSVSWFTGTVAYLPSSQSTSLSSSTRAAVAGQAWDAIHARPSDDDDDDQDSNSQSRDLWEEKHYAGLSSLRMRDMTR
jgi:diphthine-ammonia ligase